jgi:cellobiose epimerase
MQELEQYKKEMEDELENILSWWMQMTPDKENGGFYGKIDHNNKIYPEAPKGSVLNSRILWTFSSAHHLTGKKKYAEIAESAFKYLVGHFIDREFDGVYWTVDFKGEPLNTKKQIYALAFTIYGLSEYYHSFRDEKAKEKAIEIYNAVVSHSYDKENGGYIEALTRDWKKADDLRLSAKDANEKKSMNTHLHLLEAFANLYKVWEDECLKKKIVELVNIFLDHIIDNKTYHLILFFDEEWNPRSDIISYGHDIEAAWLLQEAAEAVHDDPLLEKVKKISVRVAEAAANGLDGDGGLWYEYDVSRHHLIGQKHSWPQAEAMVGFLNAWQITNDKRFLERSLLSWQFVKEYILDKKSGEWYWGINEDHSPMLQEEKAGIWKCPYHNSRACMEIIKRIKNGLN